MRSIVIGLALTAIVAVAFLLIAIAVLRAGIRRQERAACFTCHPAGRSAAIARRVLGLHTRTPSHECRQRAAARFPARTEAPPSRPRKSK
jgi:hypothetical protein